MHRAMQPKKWGTWAESKIGALYRTPSSCPYTGRGRAPRQPTRAPHHNLTVVMAGRRILCQGEPQRDKRACRLMEL